MELLKIILDNNLIYLTFNQLVDSLVSLTGESKETVAQNVQELIDNGDLFIENEKVIATANRGYLKAKISLSKKGYAFAMVDGMNDIFIPIFSVNGAMNNDVVLIEIIDKKSAENMEGKVVKILKRNTTHVVGTYIEGKSKNVVFPDDVRLPQIRIFKDDSKKAKNNDKVYVQLIEESINEGVFRGKIVEILGQANNPKAEQLSIIRSYNLDEKFEEKTILEAQAIKQVVSKTQMKKRADFTTHKVITIDGEDARDFDDALSVQETEDGFELFVHIADVSNYVVENSSLDKTAYKRGTSVYFPNMVIPMLPQELSNGICSLKENENRLTLSVQMTLNKNCDVIDSKIMEGVVNSAHRMTYTEVQHILDGDELLKEKFSDVYADILTYQHISNKLKEKRKARGEIYMNLPEPYILENQNAEIVAIQDRIQDEAHQIIESLMILCNECVAEKFNKLKLPFVYRVHEKPEEMKVKNLSGILKFLKIPNKLLTAGDSPLAFQSVINEIKDNPKEKIITKLILRTMMKAQYSPNNLGHFGLASEFYCHFTSPIRRYPDLLIHRIIKDYLHGVPKYELDAKYKNYVERASIQSSETERNADEAERSVDDYKKCVYMSKFLGEQFVGMISGVQEYGIFVELDNGIEGLVKLENLPNDQYEYSQECLTLFGDNHHFTIGDMVKVTVSNVNTSLRQIDFELVDVKKTLKDFVVKKPTKKSGKYTKKAKQIRNSKKKSKKKRK